MLINGSWPRKQQRMEGERELKYGCFFLYLWRICRQKFKASTLLQSKLKIWEREQRRVREFFSVFFSNLSQFVDVSSGNIIGVSGRTRVEEPSRFCAIFVPACAWTIAVAKKTNLCTLYFQNKGLLQTNENGVHCELLPFVRTSWPDQLVHIWTHQRCWTESYFWPNHKYCLFL